MKAHDWYVEHRADFVVRALEADDEALFRDHVARCEECAAEVAALEHDLRHLPMAVRPVAPRPDFHRRVTEAILGPRPSALQRWGWPMAAAAALLAAAVIGLRGAGRIDALTSALATRDSMLQRREAELTAVRDTLVGFKYADRVRQASIEVGGMRGWMLILADDKTHQWEVIVHGIPAAAPGQRYTFWFITGDGMRHGAEVVCDERNPAVLTLDMPPGARSISGGALTLEPMDEDPTVPVGRELAHLEL